MSEQPVTPAQVAATLNPAGPSTGEPPEPQQSFDADYVKKLRDEAARYRTEAKANANAAKELAALRDAQKSEAEKTADRIKSLEDAVATSTMEGQIRSARR
ncbi:MAG: hypothetical protein FWF36_08590 [Propionibacteriaceae bacterium]|nr:hypothetical protein [Propionibacteriaceae bacterium]